MADERQHTPEPWKIGNRGMIYTDDLRLAIMEPCKDASIEEQAANAARIVAAINTVAGMTTEELQALGLGGLAKLYADRNQSNA